MTWSFLVRGEGVIPTSFDATLDGPVEAAASTLELIAGEANRLGPEASTLCQEGLRLAETRVRGVANGKRRFSMNLSGGLGVQGAWSLTMHLNLAEDPEAK